MIETPGDDRIKFADMSRGEPAFGRKADVWEVQPTTVGHRLAIGPSVGLVDRMLELAEGWPGDYWLLYVLLVPRRGRREAGRYQAVDPLSFDEVAGFCRRFAPFFESDGRHHLWIGSRSGPDLLVYDRHEVIYAYGDLDAKADLLRRWGFREGPIAFPSPHAHLYHEAFDADEDAVIDALDWKWFPLREGEDD